MKMLLFLYSCIFLVGNILYLLRAIYNVSFVILSTVTLMLSLKRKRLAAHHFITLQFSFVLLVEKKFFLHIIYNIFV